MATWMNYDGVFSMASALQAPMGGHARAWFGVEECQAPDVAAACEGKAGELTAMNAAVDASLSNLGEGARNAASTTAAADQDVASRSAAVRGAFRV